MHARANAKLAEYLRRGEDSAGNPFLTVRRRFLADPTINEGKWAALCRVKGDRLRLSPAAAAAVMADALASVVFLAAAVGLVASVAMLSIAGLGMLLTRR